jgi:hypothetical protein
MRGHRSLCPRATAPPENDAGMRLTVENTSRSFPFGCVTVAYHTDLSDGCDRMQRDSGGGLKGPVFRADALVLAFAVDDSTSR